MCSTFYPSTSSSKLHPPLASNLFPLHILSIIRLWRTYPVDRLDTVQKALRLKPISQVGLLPEEFHHSTWSRSTRLSSTVWSRRGDMVLKVGMIIALEKDEYDASWKQEN